MLVFLVDFLSRISDNFSRKCVHLKKEIKTKRRRRHILNGLFQKKLKCNNYMFPFIYVNVGHSNIFTPCFFRTLCFYIIYILNPNIKMHLCFVLKYLLEFFIFFFVVSLLMCFGVCSIRHLVEA